MWPTYAYMPMLSVTGYVAVLAVTVYGEDQVVDVRWEVVELYTTQWNTMASPQNIIEI